MKISDYIKIKVFRDKNNIYFIIIMLISAILLIGTLTFKNNIDTYIEQYINKSVGFRTILVTPKKDEKDLGKKEILNIEHVEDAYSSAYNSFPVESDFKTSKLSGKITLTYLGDSTTLHTLIGERFNNQDKNVAIIPIEFYPDPSVYNLNIDEASLIDGHNLLGKTFNITYYTTKIEGMEIVKDEEITKTFTIIGLYDNKEMMNFNNQVFIPFSDIEEIAKANIPKNNNQKISTEQISDYSFDVVVDSLENVNYVMNRLDEEGFKNIENKVEIDTTIIDTIKISCYAVIVISTLAIILLTIFYIKKKIIREASLIGILRASGYTQKNVKKLYILEIAFTCLITYIIGIVLIVILYFAMKNTVFSAFVHIGYNVKLFFTDFIITFIIVVFLTTISSLSMIYKKTKNNIINLIESRE